MKKLSKPIIGIIIIIILASFLLFAGCKTSISDTAQSGNAQENTSVTEKETGTSAIETNKENSEPENKNEEIIVTDGMGNILTLEKAAEKIIVLTPSVLEIFEGLGAMDKIVEVDNWSVQMQDPLAEGFKGAGDANGINFEMVTKLDPDMVIVVGFGLNEDYKKLYDLGYQVYLTNSTSLQAAYTELENMGKIVGMEEEGKELSNNLKSGISEIEAKLKDISKEDRPKVFYMVWNDPIMSAGKNTFISELIEIAGGVNIVAEDGLNDWPEYSIEKLIENNPDIIIAPVSLAADASVILNDSRFSSINAVINKKVYIIPDNPISRPNQNVIKGLKMLSKAMHPDIFGEFEIIQ
ncbi:MAG: ABC transporter substrate-binding protein [Actinomycetota bacterium]|nr:ABC transporter substrate-binding protein [Actinomycetota bacterium]